MNTRDRIIAALAEDDGQTAADVAERARVSTTTARRHLTEMVAQGSANVAVGHIDVRVYVSDHRWAIYRSQPVNEYTIVNPQERNEK